MAEWAWGSATDTGRHRVMNEDSLLTAGGLFAVADGMGGANAGEVASATALETIAAAGPRNLDALVATVVEANRIVFEMALADPELRGMGTTVVAMVAMDDGPRLGIVNIGDSRAYLCRDGGLAQLSIDHSLVELLVRRGQLTPAAAAVHPQRNVLLRSLGVDAEVGVDAWEFDAAPGDRLLLCSDGLFNEVAAEDIAYMLTTIADPQAAAEALVDAANDAGGRDNITCVVVDVRGEPGLVDPPQQRLRRVVDADATVQTAMGPAGPQVPTGETQIVPVVSTPLAADQGAASSAGPVASALAGGALAGGAMADGPGRNDAPSDDAVTEQIDAVAGPAGGSEAAAGTDSLPQADPKAETNVDSARSSRGWLRPWRIVATLFSLLVLVALGIGFVSWWGSNSFFVGDDGTTVAIYQGRPGGVLWVSPQFLYSDAAIKVDTLSEVDRAAVKSGVQRPTLAEAQDYLAALRKRVDATSTTTSTTTTTARSATTIARPATTAPAGATTSQKVTTAKPATTVNATTARPTTTKAG